MGDPRLTNHVKSISLLPRLRCIHQNAFQNPVSDPPRLENNG